MYKKIILISSGQPSLNPRLVKEADALVNEGYDVTVLYAYWNDWGTDQDKILLKEKKWKAIRLGGDPMENRIIYLISRIIFKLGNIALQKAGAYQYFAKISIARSSYFLIKGAKKHKADLYIAHNLGALPAAAIAAKKYNTVYGFDAEDFHRQEVSDDVNSQHFKLAKYIEDKYLPKASYLTSSSPLISQQYEMLYNKKATSILNVFPQINIPYIINNQDTPLKLFWFSQTIGAKRGLELIIEAIGLSNNVFEFHLLGYLPDSYKQKISDLCKKNGVNQNVIHFHEPVNPNLIFTLASKFDIGFASETGFCLNNKFAVSNKIFTYIQSGLALILSSTPGQVNFISNYPNLGVVYNNVDELVKILNNFNSHRDLLYKYKNTVYKVGNTELNWELESKKFIKVIESVFNLKNEKRE